ncbi:hypothetical protein [Novosphingobium sp.]|uniref:hypothetical protein n=1 Tax=Novosphingobium sp. TaxID=1874826 RepID=UPI0025FF97AF|nr:hypothetical protein [Novosphingobium sp.]
MIRSGASGAVLALASIGAGNAWAQAAEQSDNPSTFRLPVPTQAPPRAAGPADDSGAAPAPIATKSAAPPVIALPAPSPTAKPTARPTSPPVARQTAAPVQRAPVVVPRVTAPVTVAGPTSAPVAVPSAEPVPTATPSLATPEPTASSVPAPAPTPATADNSYPAWLYAAFAAVLALVAGGLVWWRRRQSPRALPAPDFIPPMVPAKPSEDVARDPIVVPAPDFGSPLGSSDPIVTPAAPKPVLSLALEATRMSATLFNATLAYRLVVTNTGAAALSGIEIGGDMTSAHASRPTEEQLGLDGATLAPLHGVAGLAPGESVTLGGELRLPLSAILPIRRGDAQLFVPLARFAVQAQEPDGKPIVMRRAFLVGQSRSAQADKLQPFRLDLGPRLYSELGQRGL